MSGPNNPNTGTTTDDDELYQNAVDLVLSERRASTSFIQRMLGVGYNKGAQLIERMEKEGIVSSADFIGKRKVLRGAP